MLKYVAAVVVFVIGAALPTLAAAQAPYDNDQIARIKQEVDQGRTPDQQSVAPAPQYTPEADYPADARPQPCANCPQPRPHYDNVEVIKTSRDVDQSRVINTESVVHVPPRKKETNKLIIRENETRNVGVVQHNHTIIEKEVHYVKRRAPVYRVQTTYQPVCQSGALVYWVVRRGGEAMIIPAEAQVGYGNPCHRPCDCGGSVEAYAPRPVHKHSYGYDGGIPSRPVYIPLQAYGAYR
jgi:hypothetical protein